VRLRLEHSDTGLGQRVFGHVLGHKDLLITTSFGTI
jgi:hypothetical protein